MMRFGPSGILRRMGTVDRDAVARRIVAIREELGLDVPGLAKALGVERGAVYNWEAKNPTKPSMPRPPEMAKLCDKLPGLTLDYIYMGKADEMKYSLVIRLQARLQGLDPDAPGFSPASVSSAVSA